MSDTSTVPPAQTTQSAVRRFLSNFHIAGLSAVILGLAILWIFREHLKELASVLWPIVVASAIYGFRAELRSLLSRVTRVGKEGAEIGEARIAAQIMAQPVDVALKDVVPDETHPLHIRQRVDALRVELNSRIPEDVPKREYLLMLCLAEAQQIRDYQLAWLNIFNSQLEALTKMAAEQSPIDLTPYHDLHVSRKDAASTAENPVNGLSFEVWANFFIQKQLATIAARKASITQQGHDLLGLANQLNLPRFQILICICPRPGSPHSSMSQRHHCRARWTTKVKSCPSRCGYTAPGGRSGC